MADMKNPGALAGATGAGMPVHAIADGTCTLAKDRVQRHHHETADDYSDVVAQLSDRWRVAVCKDGIQWILQRRDAARAGRARWAGARYFLTKAALIRDSRALCGRIDPAAMDRLEALPARNGGAA